MIELDHVQTIEVERPITRPQYLLQVVLSSPVFLSSRKEIDADQETVFQSGKLKLKSLSSHRCSFDVCNKDYQYTLPAITGDYMRGLVRVWWAYGDVGQQWYPDEYEHDYEKQNEGIEPILVFEGEINSIDSVSEWLSLEAKRAPVSKFPKGRVLPPFANHLTPAGSVFKFAGDTYRIETR